MIYELVLTLLGGGGGQISKQIIWSQTDGKWYERINNGQSISQSVSQSVS